jgi:transposase-like protein
MSTLRTGGITRCRGRYPYVYVDVVCLRRNWEGEFKNVAILVAVAVNEDGYREALGAAEGMKVAPQPGFGRGKTHRR